MGQLRAFAICPRCSDLYPSQRTCPSCFGGDASAEAELYTSPLAAPILALATPAAAATAPMLVARAPSRAAPHTSLAARHPRAFLAVATLSTLVVLGVLVLISFGAA
jgi:hypothetical protein